MKVRELMAALRERKIDMDDPVLVWSEEWGPLEVIEVAHMHADMEAGLEQCVFLTTEDPIMDDEDDDETGDDDRNPRLCDEEDLVPGPLDGVKSDAVEEAT